MLNTFVNKCRSRYNYAQLDYYVCAVACYDCNHEGSEDECNNYRHQLLLPLLLQVYLHVRLQDNQNANVGDTSETNDQYIVRSCCP